VEFLAFGSPLLVPPEPVLDVEEDRIVPLQDRISILPELLTPQGRLAGCPRGRPRVLHITTVGVREEPPKGI
jgi:hypothetical protein